MTLKVDMSLRSLRTCFTEGYNILSSVVEVLQHHILLGTVFTASTWKSFRWDICFVTVTGPDFTPLAAKSISISMFLALSMDNFEVVL